MPAKLILLQGESGTGKSTSLENLPSEHTCIISPNSKDLPFEGAGEKYIEKKNKKTTTSLNDIPTLLKAFGEREEVNYIIIEDFTHFFNSRITDQSFIARKSGGDAFAKWNEFGADVARVINGVAETLKDDLYIIIIGHTTLNDAGEWVLQTPGKMLDQSINVVSYFTYVLHTEVEYDEKGAKYWFLTNRTATKQAKTPKGMFKDVKVPNDIFAVINRIKEYQTKK